MIYFNEEKKELAEINILPMIDVIFAILSFLIISSLYLTKINKIPLQLPLSNSTSRIDKKSLIISIDKNSNIFFKDSYDETLFINKIKKSEFYYDSINLVNVLSSENEIFNLPYKLVIKNDKFNKLVDSKFNSKKIRLNVENILYYDDEIKEGLLDILFINKTTSLKYELKKNSFFFTLPPGNSKKPANSFCWGLEEIKILFFFCNTQATTLIIISSYSQY